jgi:uncharacterized protein (TIGR03089 family)
MRTGSSPEALFADRLRDEPSSPLVTFYDDATGERAELSAKSLGNWVAKTHFLLLDELGLSVGDRAFVAMGTHWLTAPILFGCWSAGLEVVSAPQDARVAFGEADLLAGLALRGVDEVFAVSMLSMARSSTPPAGMQDFAAAVRPQPDAWATVRSQAVPADPGLDGMSRSDLAAAAVEAAATLGLDGGGRLLWTAATAGPQDWIASLLAPLTVAGSTVLVRNPDPGATDRRAASERVTVTV